MIDAFSKGKKRLPYAKKHLRHARDTARNAGAACQGAPREPFDRFLSICDRDAVTPLCASRDRRDAFPREAGASAGIGQRVQVAHHRLHPLVEHVGVNLRRGDVGVTEQLLDNAQVGAILQQVRGEGMT